MIRAAGSSAQPISAVWLTVGLVCGITLVVLLLLFLGRCATSRGDFYFLNQPKKLKKKKKLILKQNNFLFLFAGTCTARLGTTFLSQQSNINILGLTCATSMLCVYGPSGPQTLIKAQPKSPRSASGTHAAQRLLLQMVGEHSHAALSTLAQFKSFTCKDLSKKKNPACVCFR